MTPHDRSESGYAYLQLGKLARAAKAGASITGIVQTMFYVSDEFHPDALDSRDESSYAAPEKPGAAFSLPRRGADGAL